MKCFIENKLIILIIILFSLMSSSCTNKHIAEDDRYKLGNFKLEDKTDE